jgi:ribonucleoside-diphosphate reductase alpha chain
MTTLDQLKAEGEAPAWLTQEGYDTLSRGYLLSGETPRQLYQRVASAAAAYTSDPDHWQQKFFDAMWRNWLCLASPVASNLGTTRGLPISCNTLHVGDSVDSIFDKVHELATLSKNGAGVGIYIGDIRGRGSPIAGNGTSEGVVPWAKIYDQTISSVSQGSTRRGSAVLYLPIEHTDIDEFINIRRPVGDPNRRCLNINHGVVITDAWMNELIDGDRRKRELWGSILQARVETGEPYMLFVDAANRENPETYVKNGLTVKSSNLCTEIMLHTDPQHTFVCCLSSLNLVRWDEWKDTDVVRTAIRFLDCVLSEYIDKATGVRGLEASVRSAVKGRALGLGVLGWHTLLQKKGIPFDSFDAMMLNSTIFRWIRQESDLESRALAKELGEPEWCRGFGRRNTHTMAVAPTFSNSIISGGHSPGIEPVAANIFSHKTAKGTFIKKNEVLVQALESIGRNTHETWRIINENAGSVQTLDIPDEMKKVFLTAREINQHAIIKQAIQRQRWIDQGQSVNLFFASNASPKYIHEVHLAAWQGGLKSLYYLRSEGVLRGDLASRSKDECAACEA